MATLIFTALSASFLYLLSRILLKAIKAPKRTPYPPGPKGLPFVGNLFDFPIQHLADTYIEWGAKYKSNIVYASAFGTSVLIINKYEDAVELLEKRSQKYSDRPFSPIIGMMGWEKNIALMPYGNYWRLHKKICQQNFRQEAAPLYNPVQVDKMKIFLRNLIETPDDFEHHNKLFSVGIPLATMYGYDVLPTHDPCVEAADDSAFIGGSLLVPGGTLINVFPFLRHIPDWVPGATSQKMIKKVRQLTDETERIPLDNLKERMKNGPVAPSLVSTFYEKKSMGKALEGEEETVRNVAYTVYGAASDTTISATQSFFYLMAVHPEVQKRAQEEIDQFVGSLHLPSFEDRQLLPYVEAIYRELLRWRPPVPLGVPHVLSEDDYYNGYFIPKGTVVFGNIWAMVRDEEAYPDSHKFMPERFLDKNGQLNDDDRVIAYGFGRRICVGKHVASSTLWLMIVSILATFNIGKAKDDLGNEIPITHDYVDNGLIQNKKTFKCSITPRSCRARDLILEETRTEVN